MQHDTLSTHFARREPFMSLTPSQRRYLRGLAHDLKPVIQLGPTPCWQNWIWP